MKTPKLEEMTLREKIGQTLIFNHSNLGKLENPSEYFKNNVIGSDWVSVQPKETYRYIEAEMGNPNLEGRKDDMFIDFVNYANKHMSVPFMPAIDCAQGIPASKFEGHAALPTAAGLGATRDEELAYRYAKALGDDLHISGFRWVWSPIADNAGHYVDLRQTSSDTENNCKILTAFIKGMQDAGVATGVKHFPGSDPYEYRDSHFCTASYSQSYEYWEKTQGREFKACIEAGVDSIMVGHKTFRAVDDTMVEGALLPCTLSYKVVTELIKGKLGFEGVVITDGVDMKAFKAVYPPEKVYVECLKCGIDMILGPVELDYIDIIERAVLAGDLSEERINDACRRVLKMKEKYGIFTEGEIKKPTAEERKRVEDNIHAVSEDIAKKGITMTANRTGIVPIDKNKIKKVKIVYIGYSKYCSDSIQQYAIPEFERHGATVDFQIGYKREDNDTIADYDLIVYSTFIGFHAPAGGPYFFGDECKMMGLIMTKGVEKSIGVSFGSTDIFFNYFTAAKTFINCYSYNKETVEGFVKGLYGEIDFTDYNPFPLNPIKRNDDVYA